jgi:23S rRNA (pseudouridine1915-N3)-methyltransferase
MNIDICCVGSLKEAYWREAEKEYRKRLARFAKLTVTEVKEAPLPKGGGRAEEAAVVRLEGQSLLRAITPDGKRRSCLIVLDARGRDLTSEEFAAKLAALGMDGRPDASFAIGGSLGLSDEVLQAADLRLSFGNKTFPHQLMRIVLLEQLYRCFKINAGETYHK